MPYEIEIKHNGAEFEIKGDDVAGVIEIARSLGLTMGENTQKETPIDNMGQLKVGDAVKSLVKGAGGFCKAWPEVGIEGEIVAIDEDNQGVDIRNKRTNTVRWFTSGEVRRQFVKVV